MECRPVVRLEVLSVATPPAPTLAVPIGVPPSRNVTVPVGEEPETMAVSVTEEPRAAGLVEERAVVVVLCGPAVPSTTKSSEPVRPVISEALTVAPDVVYSPTLLVPGQFTNRLFPNTAMAQGLARLEISAAFTVAPEVVYSPTVLVTVSVTKRFDPEIARHCGWFRPVTRDALTVAPDVVYAPMEPFA
jgi:hypothetical protein